MKPKFFWSLAAFSGAITVVIGFVLVGRVVAFVPLYASATIRSQTQRVLADARERYGLALSYAVPSSLRCDDVRCRLTLQEPFNLAISSTKRRVIVIDWSRDDALSYAYDVAQ